MKAIPAPNQTISPEEPLSNYLNQNGVGPGLRKLEQFRTALRIRGTPPLYSQEGKGDDATIYVKLFDPCGSATWYLLEWDGDSEAFGWVEGLGSDEYGYISLEELANVRGRLGIGIEIDTSFRPITISARQRKNS
jgi:hypothetical protein